MRTITIILYFFFTIIFLASIGVTLPYVFDRANADPNAIKNFNQNIVTYFIAILFSASLDYVMKLFDDQASYRKMAILFVCIGDTAVLIMTCFILYYNSKGEIKGISGLAILGIVAAYIMWWVANYKNSAFNINATLGGNAERPLQNG
ncbi:MAG: hypothetical protein M0Q26_11035 [Chitinophagaceae bacterium]|nr:hypothetical protein [Chitinophagaceae bacterium]